jgi:CheY-like chemotaxis protein
MSHHQPPLDILIVEDEAIIAMDLEMMIEEAGHRVIADAASLHDVKALNRDLRPHIALVDMQLAQGTNGLDVAQLIRERWTETCVVFVTANPKQIPDHYCGAHGVIPKPFSRLGLLSALNYIVEGFCDPPPVLVRPGSFIASPLIASTWLPANQA